MSAKNFALLAQILFLTACVSMQDYPTAWGKPTLGSTGACPQVSGTFQNVGERGDLLSRSNLAWQLLSKRASSLKEASGLASHADRVVIQMPDSNTVSIRILSSDSVVNEFTLVREKKEFSCEGGFLAIPKGLSASSGEGGVLGFSNDTAFLALSDGGFLVVKEVSAGAGVAMFIPIAAFVTTWSRYQPAQ